MHQKKGVFQCSGAGPIPACWLGTSWKQLASYFLQLMCQVRICFQYVHVKCSVCIYQSTTISNCSRYSHLLLFIVSKSQSVLLGKQDLSLIDSRHQEAVLLLLIYCSTKSYHHSIWVSSHQSPITLKIPDNILDVGITRRQANSSRKKGNQHALKDNTTWHSPCSYITMLLRMITNRVSS